MVFVTESIKDATTGHAAVDTATTKDATTGHSAADMAAAESEAAGRVVVPFKSTAASRVTTPAGDEMIGHVVTDTATTKDATTDHAAEIGSKNGDSVFPFASVYLLPVEYLMVLLFVFAVILSVRACLKNCRPTYRGTFYAPVPELPPPAV